MTRSLLALHHHWSECSVECGRVKEKSAAVGFGGAGGW